MWLARQQTFGFMAHLKGPTLSSFLSIAESCYDFNHLPRIEFVVFRLETTVSKVTKLL